MYCILRTSKALECSCDGNTYTYCCSTLFSSTFPLSANPCWSIIVPLSHFLEKTDLYPWANIRVVFFTRFCRRPTRYLSAHFFDRERSQVRSPLDICGLSVPPVENITSSLCSDILVFFHEAHVLRTRQTVGMIFQEDPKLGLMCPS